MTTIMNIRKNRKKVIFKKIGNSQFFELYCMMLKTARKISELKSLCIP